MRDSEWSLLLRRIENGECTPFLGAGAAAHALPLGRDIAREWAKQHDYPLDDRDDLARVAQFLAIYQDGIYPKELLSERLRDEPGPDLAVPGEPHAVLARLPLPVFITTNYDDSMTDALAAAQKDPRCEICRWHDSPALDDVPSPFDGGYKPTPANPLVYHLHGRLGVPESLVLTEDDYLDFLVAIADEPGILPHQIQRALASTSVLFVGYRLADWDFRVIHRGIVAKTKRSQWRLSVTVQLSTEDPARDYLDRYFGKLDLSVYWGSAAEFAAELQERWDASR